MPYMAHSIVAFHSIVTFLELNGASDEDFVPKIIIEFWECSEGNTPIMEGAIHESSTTSLNFPPMNNNERWTSCGFKL